jgi:hypothetical protein
MEFSDKEIIFEFDRINIGFGDTEAQTILCIPQSDRDYPREIILRGDGLKALYNGLKLLFNEC